MRMFRYAALLLSAGLLAACGSPALPSSAPPSGAAPRQAGARTTTVATLDAVRGTVPVVTGGEARIVPGRGGQPTVSLRPSVTRSGQLTSSATATFDVGGDLYAIPGNALPYLGTLFDPALFDVSYLERAGYGDRSSVPVIITWRHAAHAAVPGLATARTGLHTTGSIATSSASFGQELTSDLRTHRGPLSEIEHIALARPRTRTSPAGIPEAVSPPVPLRSARAAGQGRLYSLTVSATDHSGRPTYALVAVQNLGNFSTYYSVAELAPGADFVASVPAGHYSVEALDVGYNSLDLIGTMAVAVRPDVTVSRDTDIALSARTAVPVSVSVPTRGAKTQLATLGFTRMSAAGGGLSGGLSMWGPGTSSLVPVIHMYATPTPRPRTGTLGYNASWALVPADTGLASPDIPYTYYLDYSSPAGIPAALSHRVTMSDVATVRDSFASPASGDGDMFFATPYQSWASYATSLYPSWYTFPAPTSREDYFGGSAGTTWQLQAELVPAPISSLTPVSSPIGPFQTFRPGQVRYVTWGGGPAVPAPEWQDQGVANDTAGGGALGNTSELAYVCPVCREGSLLSFNAQVADGDPEHADPAYGFGTNILASTTGAATDTLKFYVNGRLTQESDRSGQVYPLLPATADYKVDWSSSTPAGWSDLGVSEDSVWTFRSGPGRASRLPAYELCSPDPSQSCAYQPLVFASYRFNDGLTGQVTAPGTETFEVTGYHERGDDAPPVSQASAEVSFNDGTTWTPASVTSLGRGTFRVTVTDPDTSGYASVRITLSDGAGDTLRQTIIHAWALAPASDSGSEGR
jgi:hypothetical protein